MGLATRHRRAATLCLLAYSTLRNTPRSRLRRLSVFPIALAALTAGCGGSSTLPTAARVTTICTEADNELLTIAKHTFGSLTPRLADAVIARAVRESQRVDARASTRLRDLPQNSSRSVALTNLAHSETELRGVLGVLRRTRGIGLGALPHGFLLRFLESNSGCGTVRLRAPTTG